MSDFTTFSLRNRRIERNPMQVLEKTHPWIWDASAGISHIAMSLHILSRLWSSCDKGCFSVQSHSIYLAISILRYMHSMFYFETIIEVFIEGISLCFNLATYLLLRTKRRRSVGRKYDTVRWEFCILLALALAYLASFSSFSEYYRSLLIFLEPLALVPQLVVVWSHSDGDISERSQFPLQLLLWRLPCVAVMIFKGLRSADIERLQYFVTAGITLILFCLIIAAPKQGADPILPN